MSEGRILQYPEEILQFVRIRPERRKRVLIVGLFFAVALGFCGGAFGCSPKLVNAPERKSETRSTIPSAIALESRNGYHRITPKLLARELPLRLVSKIPCEREINGDVLISEYGQPIGVKLEKANASFALCEDAVVSYLLNLPFSPGRVGNGAVVSWTNVTIQIESPTSLDSIISERSASR
jgi:hypothetical protein